MKSILSKLHKLVIGYVTWGWPFLLAAGGLSQWLGDSDATWRSLIDDAAFAWILCAPAAPLTLLLDRAKRERAMARLCGLREGDERERAVTGEAARATLLLTIFFQTVLLAMSLVTVQMIWNPSARKKDEHGLITVGLSFNSTRHLDPFGASLEDENRHEEPAPSNFPVYPSAVRFGGSLISPSAFSILLLLILVELAAFKAYSGRRYEGLES